MFSLFLTVKHHKGKYENTQAKHNRHTNSEKLATGFPCFFNARSIGDALNQDRHNDKLPNK